jgi:hypothetical protein
METTNQKRQALRQGLRLGFLGVCCSLCLLLNIGFPVSAYAVALVAPGMSQQELLKAWNSGKKLTSADQIVGTWECNYLDVPTANKLASITHTFGPDGGASTSLAYQDGSAMGLPMYYKVLDGSRLGMLSYADASTNWDEGAAEVRLNANTLIMKSKGAYELYVRKGN